MIIDNEEYFKLTLSLIFYTIFYSSSSDSLKIAEHFGVLINNIFNIDTTKLIENLFKRKKFNEKDSNDKENPIEENNNQNKEDDNNTNTLDLKIFEDKDLDYLEILESLKNKNNENVDIDKFYNIDLLAETIQINNKISGSTNFMNSKLYSDFESVISLTPSLESQETGRTYKEIILMNEEENENDPNVNKSKLFYPSKNKSNILFFTNEHYYVCIRFIFCIYERLNKLGDSSAGFDYFTHNNNNDIDIKGNDMCLLKNFVTIYKAFLHKKIDNLNLYEEYCREILGNESYFLLNIDKLINSVRLFYLIN